MKIFRVRQIYKVLYLACILLLLGLMGFLGFTFVGAATSLSGTFKRTISIMWLPTLIYSIPFLLLIVWLSVYLVACQKMRLIFDNEKITLESIKRLRFLLQAGYKSFELSYDQIKKVKFEGFIGRMLFIDQKEKKVYLYPMLFDKNYGKQVLAELQNRLPTETFEPDIRTLAIPEIWSRQNKIRITFAIVILVLYITTMFLDPHFTSRSWLTDDWDVKLNPKGYESAWTYSIDSQNTFWVVSWRSSYYRVYHFSDKLENEWKLPKELLGEQYPQLVSNDGAGSPIIWADRGIYFSKNNGWNWKPYANNLNLENSSALASGEHAWVIDEQKQILKINALTAAWTIIPLPKSALAKKLQPKSLRPTKDGNILVLMQNDNSSRVYLLSLDDKWKHQEFSVISSENIFIQDYFLDDHNVLWILSSEQKKFFIQKIDSNENLLLTKLPSPLETEDWERYRSLLVDSSGRLWVEGGHPYFMAVFSPVWNDTAEEIVRYTEDNSAYQGGISASPILMPDGRIWSFGRRLSTMNAHLANLPSPLPTWFAALDWNLIRLGVILAQLPFYFVLYLFSVKPMVFQKRNR